MSPLRYQKWLRLNEVRRTMLNERKVFLLKENQHLLHALSLETRRLANVLATFTDCLM